MRQNDTLTFCASCGRAGRIADVMNDGWRYHRDRLGELVLFCALCTYRELRPEAPAATD